MELTPNETKIIELMRSDDKLFVAVATLVIQKLFAEIEADKEKAK